MRTYSFLVLLIGLAACNRPQSSGQTTVKTDSQADTMKSSAAKTSFYATKTPAYDGIGQKYMGREIAQVMGHLGAEWLERPEREQEERTDLLLTIRTLNPLTWWLILAREPAISVSGWRGLCRRVKCWRSIFSLR